jgi:predicted nucleic acid-binding Zn ribbon protein
MTNNTMTDDQLTLEEKVDEILKYQRRMYRAQIIKSVINFILFMVFIVLPIAAFYFWIRTVDFSGVIQTVNSLKESTGGIEKLNEALKNLPL